MSVATDFRHLVRIAGRDLDGSKKLIVAISDLRGVGYNFASVVTSRIGLDPRARLGTLSEDQIREVEKAIQSATKSSLPAWYYNRRNDPSSGETKQLLGSDLDFVIKGDVDDEKNIQSWKGVRHSLGLKVRGQRTRTTGRKGRTVGVRKAALIAAAKEAGEKKEEK
jgi:small subunit ribosomal protein S13